MAVKTECQPTEAEVVPEIPEPAVLKEEIKKEKVKLFGKMFKKKAADVKSVQRKETSNEDQADASPPATDPQPVSRLFRYSFLKDISADIVFLF